MNFDDKSEVILFLICTKKMIPDSVYLFCNPHADYIATIQRQLSFIDMQKNTRAIVRLISKLTFQINHVGTLSILVHF